MHSTTSRGLLGRAALLLLTLTLASGCGADADKAGIKGKVTVDGQPVDSGSISFDPIEGTQSPNAGAVITAGVFEVAQAKGPKPGTYRVRIQGSRKTGKQIEAGRPAPPGTMIDEVLPIVPDKYNAASTEKATLKAGPNVLDFNLSSK